MRIPVAFTMRKSFEPVSHLAPRLRATTFLRSTAAGSVSADALTRPAVLTDRQREQLARIGTRLRLPPRMVIYREDSPAHWVFAVAEGVVKSYRDLPSGKRAIGAFLFARDLFGLAEQGRYLNCAQAISRVTLYRLPLDELVILMRHDADLQFQFLVKVTHELRESQRRAILLARRDAAGRLAMFLMLMRDRQDPVKGRGLVALPMSRTDISNFLGLSLESVSRAAAELERRGLVTFEGRHLARIADESRLAKLAAEV
jgi:CRP/FNR family transcriptional regulator